MKSLFRGMHSAYLMIMVLLYVAIFWMMPIINAGSQLFGEIPAQDWRASTQWRAQTPRCEVTWVFYNCSVKIEPIDIRAESPRLDYLLLEPLPMEKPAVLESSNHSFTLEFAKSRPVQRVIAMLLWILSMPLAVCLALFGFSFFLLWRKRTRPDSDTSPALGKIPFDLIFFAIVAHELLGVYGVILVLLVSWWRARQKKQQETLAKIDAYLSNDPSVKAALYRPILVAKPMISAPPNRYSSPTARKPAKLSAGRTAEFPQR